MSPIRLDAGSGWRLGRPVIIYSPLITDLAISDQALVGMKRGRRRLVFIRPNPKSVISSKRLFLVNVALAVGLFDIFQVEEIGRPAFKVFNIRPITPDHNRGKQGQGWNFFHQ